MKWRMCLGYAIRTIQKRYGLFLLNFAVLALCFYITDMLATDYIYKEKTETMQIDMMRFPPERTGKLLFNEGLSLETQEEIVEYQAETINILQEIQSMKEIESFGSFTYTTMESKKLWENETIRQWYANAYGEVPDWESVGIPILQLNGEGKDLGTIELQEGNLEQFFLSQEGISPVLVGADFLGIVQVGDILSLKKYQDTSETEFQVIGILKEDSHWYGENAFYLRGLQTLDRSMVILNDEAIPMPSDYLLKPQAEFYFLVKEGYHCEKVIENIQNLFREKGVVGRAGMVTELLDDMMDTMNESLEKQMQFCVIVIMVAFLFVAVHLVIQIWERKKEFGICCACGMNKKDLAVSLCLEELIIAFLSWGLVYGLRGWELYKNANGPYIMGDPQESFDWMMRTVHGRETLMIGMGLVIVIAVLAWMVVRCVLRKTEISILVR